MQESKFRSIQVGAWACALVDVDDYDRLIHHKWHLNSDGYAYRWTGDRKNRRAVRMHREIMGISDARQIDHRDGNPLNNRKSNLRIATLEQNLRNRRKWGSNPFKGVQRLKNGSFSARIVVNGKQTHLGCFPSAEEAAREYDVMALSLFGEFARLNFSRAGAA